MKEKTNPESPRFKRFPRVFMTEEGNPAIVRLNQLRAAFGNAREITDLIVNDRGLEVSQNRGQIAQDMISAAERTLLSFDRNGLAQTIKLSTKDQRRILLMVEEVLSGKREAVQFQLTRNCDGIKEVFSREVFKSE